MLGVGAFSGQSSGKPVRLTRLVLVNLAEAKTLEPRRGSGGHVSSRIPAVNDDWAPAIQRAHAFFIDVAQRDADRAGQVVFGVLLGRQDLDQLRALPYKLTDLTAIDERRHTLNPSERRPRWLPQGLRPARASSRQGCVCQPR